MDEERIAEQLGRIEAKVDGMSQMLSAVERRLAEMNGRVRRNEIEIARMRGWASVLGGAAGIVVSAVVALFYRLKQ